MAHFLLSQFLTHFNLILPTIESRVYNDAQVSGRHPLQRILTYFVRESITALLN